MEKAFNDYVENNQKHWSHDRNSTVGASEIFGCHRQTFFNKRGEELGYECDEDFEESWGAMERGNTMEDHWVVPVIEWYFNEQDKSDIQIKFHGEDQHTLVSGYNSSTPDGLIVNAPSDFLSEYGIEDIESDCVCFEIKSVDPRLTLDKEKFIHRGQTQQQMGVFRDTTEYQPKYAVILYVNCSFYDDINVFVIEYEDKTWKSAQIRANKVFTVDDPTKFHAEGLLDDGCKYCKWKQACADASEREVPKPKIWEEEIAEGTDLDTIVFNYIDVREEIKELEKERDHWKLSLTDILKEKEVNGLKGSEWGVKWTWNPGKETLDQAAMKEDGIDPDSYKKQGKGFTKLTVTKKKPKPKN